MSLAHLLNAPLASGLSEPHVKVGVAVSEFGVAIADGSHGDSGVARFEEHPENLFGQFMTRRPNSRRNPTFGPRFGDGNFFDGAESPFGDFLNFSWKPLFHSGREP